VTSNICRTAFTIVSFSAILLGLSACDAERSANPLSPQIAGPLAGVLITTPAAVQPANGLLVADTEQPVTVRFMSAESNSVRPFTYELQVATDSIFAQTVLHLTEIEPGASGEVIVELAQTFEPGVYYWRTRAVDGANSGEYSPAASFELFTPVVIGSATASSPADGVTVVGTAPTLVAAHATITGPAESTKYRFELSNDPGFLTLTAVLETPPSGGDTTSFAPGGLPYDQLFYWRVRAFATARNGQVLGPWDTTSFRTQTAPVIIGTPEPVSPVGNATTATVRPTLTARNGTSSGPTGIVNYRFEVSENTSFGSPVASVVVSASGSGTTTATLGNDLAAGRSYFWRVSASNADITTSWSDPQPFRTPSSGGGNGGDGGGGRTPDPPPGGQLPLPDESAVIDAVAAANPGALANSCVHEGGTWEFMDLAVEALRNKDTRWGYNCKRGNCDDPSIDVVNYFYGSGNGDQSAEVYIIDIILAVCPSGSGAAPAWTNQTGTGLGRWIYPRP
jgi:hypothetical protein